MKNYFELIQEVLNQRGIVDNRNIVAITEVSDSVMIAFNQACEFMRDLHNWKWNYREDEFVNAIDDNSYPMPYGVVHGVVVKSQDGNKKYTYRYVSELDDCDCKTWTYAWDTEQIIISPRIDENLANSTTIIQYHDKHIACLTNRVTGQLLERFDPTADVTDQYLNVPEYIYDAYARCVILKTRLLLNEGMQGTTFQPQTAEFKEAYNCLMGYAKTPFYKSERMEI